MRYASPEAALATLGVGLTLPVLSVGCGPVECGSGAKPFVVHGESLDLDLASGLATPGLLDGLPFAYNFPRESGEATCLHDVAPLQLPAGAIDLDKGAIPGVVNYGNVAFSRAHRCANDQFGINAQICSEYV